MNYEHRTAYRHTDGTVEGFLGVGSTKKAAADDATEQMKRKADIVADWLQNDVAFDKTRVVTVLSSLAKDEVASVQADWRTNTRY